MTQRIEIQLVRQTGIQLLPLEDKEAGDAAFQLYTADDCYDMAHGDSDFFTGDRAIKILVVQALVAF